VYLTSSVKEIKLNGKDVIVLIVFAIFSAVIAELGPGGLYADSRWAELVALGLVE
jgi:hypothetical protein